MPSRLVGGLTALVAIVTLPLGLLSALFVSVELGAAVVIVGWLLLTPLIPIVGGEILPALWSWLSADDADERANAKESDALTDLKQRYANGEIDDAEFERRVENLVAVDDIPLEDAADAVATRADEADAEAIEETATEVDPGEEGITEADTGPELTSE